jgi:uncharacterized protein
MGKILFWVVVGLIAVIGFRWWQARQRLEQQRPPAARDGEVERMVGCARCGVNIPQSEAVQQDGRWVCADVQCPRRPPGG